MRVKTISTVVVILLILSMFTVVYAENSVVYYTNGNIMSIATEKNETVNYYENGAVKSITTPKGTAQYDETGQLTNVTGTPSISLEEANAMLVDEKANETEDKTVSVENKTPKEDKVTETMPETGVQSGYIVLLGMVSLVGIFSLLRYRSLNKF